MLPQGHPLPEEIWLRRHKAIVAVLWLHAGGLVLFGLFRGYGIAHSALEGGILIIPALIASSSFNRTIRASAATIGLMTASGVLVHLSNGTIEAHFHFFVMVTVIVIYQQWAPFLLAVGYVVAHHAILGTIDPHSVFNHPAALQAPFKWAIVHGVFILGASVAGLVIWKRNEELMAAWEETHQRLYEADARRRQALEINDSVLQGLVIADYAFKLGHDEKGRAAVAGALAATKGMVTDLLDDDAGVGNVKPGQLVRRQKVAAQRTARIR